MTHDVGMWHGSGFWFSNHPLIATMRHLLEVDERRPKTITASYLDDVLMLGRGVIEAMTVATA